MRSSSFALALCLGRGHFCNAWAPPGPLAAQKRSTTRLFNDRESLLRQEIADRNSLVLNEEQYAVVDGELLVEKLNNVESSSVEGASSTITNAVDVNGARETDSIKSRIARLTRPRAYPLFLAEKGAELMEAAWSDFEATWNDFATTWNLVETDSKSEKLPNGSSKKERVVILGTGWGAASFLKSIDTDKFDVTVVSPRNHFVFTPMLAGASVGTVDYRSITEPIREINRKAKYLEATASAVDPESKRITCQSVVCDGNSCEVKDFTVSYDRLIVSVGAQTNTFGVPGVREYCCFLKQIEDASRIRTSIVNCFERANLPYLTDEERKHILTFAVIGAGPTGIEFAAELRDFVEQDGPKYYADLLKYVRIKVIEASSTILAPFDKSLQEEAIKQLSRTVEFADPQVRDLIPEPLKLIELLLDSSVKEVGSDTIYLKDGTEIPYGLSVWAAGNGPLPLTLQLIDALGGEQTEEQAVARGRLAIDPWMRVIGSGGSILAFGDCTCVTNSQLPATAQVASQQGEYLAGIMNKQFDLSPPLSAGGLFFPPVKVPDRTEISLSDLIANFATNNDQFAKPFQFLNLGILAYTGGATALAQVATAPNAPPIMSSGKVGNALWRSVYLSKQVSWRNRLLVLNDWAKRKVFGRDITRV